MQPIPLPKVDIPQTWSSAQALMVIEFLHSIIDKIWDWHGDAILDMWQGKGGFTYDDKGNERPQSSYENDFPF